MVPGGGHCDYRDSGQTITTGRQERPSWSGRKVQAWKSIDSCSCCGQECETRWLDRQARQAGWTGRLDKLSGQAGKRCKLAGQAEQ